MPAVTIQFVAAAYAALFAVAALGKASAWGDWSALAADVAGKRAALVRVLVPLGEGGLAVVLVLSPFAGLSAAASVLAFFAAAVLILRRRLGERTCGCFGRLSRGRLSGRLAARNAVLAAAALAAAFAANLSGAHRLSWWSVVVVLVSGAVLAGLRGARSLRQGRRVGSAAPDLAELGGPGPALLVFVRKDCGPCRSLLPQVAAWQRDLAGALSVVALDVEDGPTAQEPAWPELLPGRSVAERYGVHATPAAVAVGADGRISARAEGGEAIVSLAERLGRKEDAREHRPWPVQGLSRRRLLGEGGRIFAGGILGVPVLLRLPLSRRAATCDPCIKTKCSCNQKLYDDPQVCLAECRVRLGVCFTGICGPVPSDHFHCGSTCCEPGQKCVNGACVGSCPPDQKPCGCTCCPPRQMCEDKRCVPKTMCGPDITDALGEALDRTEAEFGKWSSSDRDDACKNLVSIPWATFSWDITQLSPAGREKFTKDYGPECSSCGFSVQIGSDCHFDGTANYSVYGKMMSLCHGHYKAEDSWKAHWHTEDYMILLIAAHKSFTGLVASNVGSAAEWASAGYRGWPKKGKTPGGDRPKCEPGCPNKYSGPGLTVQWYPHVIRP